MTPPTIRNKITNFVVPIYINKPNILIKNLFFFFIRTFAFVHNYMP